MRLFRKRIVPKGNDKVTFDYFNANIEATNSVVNELYDRVKELEQSVTYCDICGYPVLLYEKWEYVGKNRVSHSSHLKH